ncbi:hypothetical protein LSAT2_032557, partial [Lamellibrachia satsuma]
AIRLPAERPGSLSEDVGLFTNHLSRGFAPTRYVSRRISPREPTDRKRLQAEAVDTAAAAAAASAGSGAATSYELVYRVQTPLSNYELGRVCSSINDIYDGRYPCAQPGRPERAAQWSLDARPWQRHRWDADLNEALIVRRRYEFNSVRSGN